MEFESEVNLCPICELNMCIEGYDWCFDCRDEFEEEIKE